MRTSIFALQALAEALADLAYHGGRGDVVDRFAGLIPLIEGRGAWRRRDGATQLAASALGALSHDARWHDIEGACCRRATSRRAAGPGGRGVLVSERLRVNPIMCTAHGMCAELLPEFITLDPWGYRIVPDEPVPDELTAWPGRPPPRARRWPC